jgi:hypothetical protein
MVGNNGNYTPPVYGDPRNGPATGSMGWSEVRSVPATRPGAYTTQVELRGDIKAAEAYIPVARQQMAMMHRVNVNNLEIADRPVDLGGGSSILCQRRHTADTVTIDVPTKAGQLGPMHFSFDGSSEKYYQSNQFIDKVNGLPSYFLSQSEGPALGYPFLQPSFGTFNGSSGVGIRTGIGEAGISSFGILVFSPKTVSAFSTVFLVASVLAGGYTASGSISSSTDVDFQGKRFLVSVGCRDDGRFTINSDAGYYTDIVSSGMKFILCQTCTPTGSIVDGYPVVIYRNYFNGTQILEREQAIANEWRTSLPSGETLGDDEVDYIVKNLYCGSANSYSAFHQAMYLNDTSSSDEIQKTTDILAGKWGL